MEDQANAPQAPVQEPVVTEPAAPAPVEPVAPVEPAPAEPQAPVEDPAPAESKVKKAVKKLIECVECAGSGLKGGFHFTNTELCPNCDGSGKVKA